MPRKGYKQTEEHIKGKSDASKGRKGPMCNKHYSEETKNKRRVKRWVRKKKKSH